MTQDQINQAEWTSPDNWGGPSWMAVYFSKNDSRTWVPKRIPWMGWTINLAHTAGVCWLVAILIGLPLMVAVISILSYAAR